jgi:Asp-tRNA(Asn)/Glu-tRNA(Gln) amidotransferase A subunit family amidase
VAALEDAAARLAKAGARVETLTLPDDIAALTEAHQVIMTYEVARSLHHDWTGHRDRLGAQIAGRIERGLATPFADYTLALAQARAARRTFRDLVERFDAILTPCAPGEAPEGLKETGDRRFQSIWTLLHAPCVALPTHRGAAGLPVGIQLVGRLDEDMALIASARWVWDTLRPA